MMKKRTQLSAILLALILATSSLSACKAQDSTTLNAHASQKTVTENENSTQETSDYISDIVSDAEESIDIEFSENVVDEESVESSEEEIEKVYTKADVDGNGKITADDYILLKRAIFGMTNFNEEQMVAGDLNNNGKLDPTDYICLKRVYFGTANLEDILNGKPVEDELSEDVSDIESSELIEESSDVTHGEYESSVPKDEPSESEPVESEIESSKEESSEPSESSEEESSEPIEDSSSEAEPVISIIPSVPSEDDPIENDPVEESSEAESSVPPESVPEESTPTEDPFAKYHVQINTMSQEEAEALIEECILMYINKYRVEEGKCEMTMLNGKSRAYARGRSVQLTTNFAHDTKDERTLATELEYGIYVPEEPETKYDRETGTIIYTGNIIPAYYQPYGGEAISEVGALAEMWIDDVAGMSAGGIFKSKAHWEYIGHKDNDCIAIGVTLSGGHACICYLSMDTESAELYD